MKKALFILAALLLPLTACSDQKLAQAFYDTSVGLNSTTKVIIQLHGSKIIDDATFTDLLKSIRPAIQIHREAVQFVKATGQLDGTNTIVLLSYLDSLAKALQDLEQLGVIRITDPGAQRGFAAGVQTARTAALTLRALISAIKKPTPVSLGKAVTV